MTERNLWVVWRAAAGEYLTNRETAEFGPLALAERFATREDAEKHAGDAWVIWRL